ncbi:MAG: hypothetical protein J3Q66DRAFT_334856 [Benniella sp.]|nr:MAG: hypothetical protein J3Q66DRAFT_334856 [Benniella sp.]
MSADTAPSIFTSPSLFHVFISKEQECIIASNSHGNTVSMDDPTPMPPSLDSDESYDERFDMASFSSYLASLNIHEPFLDISNGAKDDQVKTPSRAIGCYSGQARRRGLPGRQVSFEMDRIKEVDTAAFNTRLASLNQNNRPLDGKSRMENDCDHIIVQGARAPQLEEVRRRKLPGGEVFLERVCNQEEEEEDITKFISQLDSLNLDDNRVPEAGLDTRRSCRRPSRKGRTEKFRSHSADTEDSLNPQFTSLAALDSHIVEVDDNAENEGFQDFQGTADYFTRTSSEVGEGLRQMRVQLSGTRRNLDEMAISLRSLHNNIRDKAREDLSFHRYRRRLQQLEQCEQKVARLERVHQRQIKVARRMFLLSSNQLHLTKRRK